ncbi:MAG: response regulator [Thermoanaerobaculia bacterium]
MAERRGARVLIVDDDPGVRQFLIALLTRDGISSAVAEDGQAAIEILGRERFDVILLDMLMPRVDGLGVLRYMRDQAIDTPVVVVSAVSDQMAELIDPTLVRVALQKPFDPRGLRDVVAAVIAETDQAVAASGRE